MDLTRWFTDLITYANVTGHSRTDPSYGAQATMTARIQPKSQTIRTADGRFIQTTYTLYSPTALGLYARVWLPGADTAKPSAANRVQETVQQKDKYGRVKLCVAYL